MKMHILDLTEAFIRAAQTHGEGIQSRNSKLANKSYDEIIKVIRECRDKWGAERELVFPLLSHENSSVRVWAALFSLQTDEVNAVNALTSVSKEPGLIGFSAKMTLQEWKKGTLGIPQ